MSKDVFRLYLAINFGKAPHEIDAWPQGSVEKLMLWWNIMGPFGIGYVTDILDAVHAVKKGKKHTITIPEPE